MRAFTRSQFCKGQGFPEGAGMSLLYVRWRRRKPVSEAEAGKARSSTESVILDNQRAVRSA